MIWDPLREQTSISPGSFLESTGAIQESLRNAAEQARDGVFGRKIFVRGVIEVSNFCRQNCNYCGMRRDNKSLGRNRLTKEIILEQVLAHLPHSVTDLNIQAGEDPIVVREVVVPLIQEIRALRSDLGITACLGTLSHSDYSQLRQSGANIYIIKLESGDPEHYASINAPGTFASRIEAIRHLAATGWSVSSGFIVGLPHQTQQHILNTLKLLGELPLEGCSVSPFIAGEQTPFANEGDGRLETTLNCLALMRLANPNCIIPAVSAMGLVGEDGYTRAIRTGANLATINLTPTDLRGNYLIYKRDRMIMSEQRVLSSIEKAGCVPSPTSLLQYLKQAQQLLAPTHK